MQRWEQPNKHGFEPIESPLKCRLHIIKLLRLVTEALLMGAELLLDPVPHLPDGFPNTVPNRSVRCSGLTEGCMKSLTCGLFRHLLH